VLETATSDERWRQFLNRSEVIADAIFRAMGPFAIRDLQLATEAGRFQISDPALVWRLATHAIVGVSLAATMGEVPQTSLDETVIALLCMTGIGFDEARHLSKRPRPRIAEAFLDEAAEGAQKLTDKTVS